jgi:hypothetical protein
MNIHPTKKLGLIKRPIGRKTCHLKNYLDLSKLPQPPSVVNWLPECPQATQLFANDQIGDCAVAGFLHIQELILGAAKKPKLFTDTDAIALYTVATATLNNGVAYSPDNPDSDTGLVLIDFLEFLRKQGEILAHAEVNLANDQMLQIGRYLFGGLYRGFNMPVFVQNLQNIWEIPDPTLNLGDATPASWGGHCVSDYGHELDGSVNIVSWGDEIVVKPDFLQKYQSEAHIIIFPDSPAADDNFIGGNFALQDLISDLNQLKY